jgi:transposase-like protein
MTNRNAPKRAASSESKYSLMEFMKDFPDDNACLNWLWRNRYAPDGKHTMCPHCQEIRMFQRYSTSQQRQSWTCTHCGHHLHPTAGTIFHKSSTSLHLWFYAMYLMTSTRCGISAKQVERELGVTYKTAWRMCHLIRNELMRQDDALMSGAVEADETYIGGRRRVGKGGRSGRPKPGLTHFVPVLGVVQRKGHVFATKVPNLTQATIYPHIEKRVLPDTTIYTDEYGTYRSLTTKGYQHRRIQHKQNIYVSGDIHTNTIEGFWSLVKRGLGGVYHSVSAKYLDGYLNEYAWRYNRRGEKDERSLFAQILLRAALPI